MVELLNDMALYVEVVKTKSFRRAAESLGMPNSTLSRRISALEKAIGLRLLNRTTRRIEPTEAGLIYFERSKRIVDEARLAHEQLGGLLAQPKGLLRVSLPADFTKTYLSELLIEFTQRYPDISFELDLTPRKVDLVAEPYDVAIRMGVPKDSFLVARKIGQFPAYLYASPSYLKQHGMPNKPSDLSKHQCIGMLKANSWILHSENRKINISTKGRFMLNSVGVMCRLATLGQGIAMMTEKIADEYVKSKQLRRVLADWEGEPVVAYAVTETRLVPAKTQLFIDFLRQRLK